MSDTVKFKLRMVKYLEPFTTLPSNPTGPRKNIATVYEDLTTISDIVDKIEEFFVEENTTKFSFNGTSLTYDEETPIEIDTEDLTERIKGFFENVAKYGEATWSQEFDAQGCMNVNWSDNIKYTAQLIITEPKPEVPVVIYPQEYKD